MDDAACSRMAQSRVGSCDDLSIPMIISNCLLVSTDARQAKLELGERLVLLDLDVCEDGKRMIERTEIDESEKIDEAEDKRLGALQRRSPTPKRSHRCK